MEKRSIFLIIFSIIGLIAISIMDVYKVSELLQWIVLIIYLLVVFITMYLPTKKEKENKKVEKKNKELGKEENKAKKEVPKAKKNIKTKKKESKKS